MRSITVHNDWFGFYVGRDFCRALDCSIFIGLGKRPNKQRFEVRYKLSFELSWNWSPDLQYERATFDEIDSSSWTGRDWRWRGWAWAKSVHLTP